MFNINEYRKNFENSTLLITGGTGSFGSTLLDLMIPILDVMKEIRIFSRDEKKQYDMRSVFQDEKIKFFIGDVRDAASIQSAMVGVDYVFHAAALKQVPSCEFFPLEAVKTNVLGTSNVIQAAKLNRVKKVVCLSTDKAAYPINAMGISKAMMEKLAIAESRNSDFTEICITRYGNVLASRGSVIPLFVNQIENNKRITITDPNMTRFVMTLTEAVELVMFAFVNGRNGDLLIKKAPATSIGLLSNVLKRMYNYHLKDDVIGIREGEKLYETLATVEEIRRSEDLGDFFRVPSTVDSLNYSQYFSQGIERDRVIEFNSATTNQMTNQELIDKLKSIGYGK